MSTPIPRALANSARRAQSKAPEPTPRSRILQRVHTPVAEQGDRNLDDRLGLGPGVQNVRRNRQRKTPEFATADDPRQGLAGRAPRGEIGKLSCRRSERLLGLGDHCRPRHAAGRADHEPRFAARVLNAAAPKRIGKAGECFRQSRRRAVGAGYAQATWPWQCLNFLPEPHGQGSFRPTRPHVAGFLGSRSATATPEAAARRAAPDGSARRAEEYSFSPLSRVEMLKLHGRGRRLRLLEPHFDSRHLRNDGFMPLGDQLPEQLEGFRLVLVKRISLRHAAPADDLTQMIEGHEMLAPQMIERLQNHLLFHEPHGLGRIALDTLRVGVVGSLVEPVCDLFVGDFLFLGPFVDRQVEVQLVVDLILQAHNVPRLGIGVVRNVLGDDIVDDAGAHVLDRRTRANRTPSSCADLRR